MNYRKLVVILLVFSLILPLYNSGEISAKVICLDKKSIVVKAGKSATIKVKNAKKKARWSIKSGKKYIRLKAKKRASVKVVGVKRGTAKVQCKIGQKKLICKVKVTEKVKRKPTVSQPPVTVSPVPTAVPTESPVVTQTPRPSHIPTEDRLMAEPRKEVEEDPNEEPTGLYLSWPTQAYYFFGSDIQRISIEKVIITDSVRVPDGVLGSMDLSERQNKSVMAWYVDGDGDGDYEMTIGQEGGVVANPDSSYLFYGISFGSDEAEPVCGLENLYTSEVKDMSYMFACLGAMNQKFEFLNLGNWFETSNVENMEVMFATVGSFYFKELRLGEKFNVSKVTNAILMFEADGLRCGIYDVRCYVNSEELKQWILDKNNHTAWENSFMVPEYFIVEN